jgi:cell wall assembly regulator SMI1
MATWDQFREAVSTRGLKGRPATARDLDAFEAEHGFRLPSRFREFASAFGAGRLIYKAGGKEKILDFSVPGGPTVGGGRFYNIEIFNNDLRKAGKPTAGRMVHFAQIESEWGGLPAVVFGWDIDEVTVAESHDYAIYRRRPSQKARQRVASTFEEFLVEYCLGKPLAAWIAAGHPPDREIPEEDARDDPSRIRYAQHYEERNPRPRATKAAPRVGAVHRLAGAPERCGAGGEGLHYRELLPDGTIVERTWIPDGEADRGRLEEFWRACQNVAWKDGMPHDVASPPFRPLAALAASPPSRIGTKGKAAPATKSKRGLIRRVPHEPAPVAESWRRIEAWLSAHCPEVVAALRPGLPEKAIAAVEKVLGLPLPEDVKASYRIHDGRGRIPEDFQDRAKREGASDRPGFVTSVFYNLGLDRLDEARKAPTAWDDVEEEPDRDRDNQDFPPDAIRRTPEEFGLVPLFEDENGDAGLGIDLDPGPNGVVGQVVLFDRRHRSRSVLARSWGQFLEDYADELEAGNFEFRQEPGDWGRALWLKRPKAEPFQQHARAWSEAKLDHEFLAARPVPEPALVPADPETDRACRAAVEGFIAEHHAWEVRWQGVRPVARLGFESIGETEDGDIGYGMVEPNRHLEPGQPPPEALRFFKSAAARDIVKRAEFLKTNLQFGKYYAEAMAGQRLIHAKYATAWQQRRLGTMFWLRDALECDPAIHRPIAVLRRDATTAYVVMDPLGDDRIYRYKLKREYGVWRIERMQTSDDGGPFKTRLMTSLPRTRTES